MIQFILAENLYNTGDWLYMLKRRGTMEVTMDGYRNPFRSFIRTRDGRWFETKLYMATKTAGDFIPLTDARQIAVLERGAMQWKVQRN